VTSDQDASAPPPLPSALVQAVKLPGDKAPGPKRRRKWRKTAYAVSLLVIGGIVTLSVNLILNRVQESDTSRQTKSGHQYQLWQNLQVQADDEATYTLQIYSDAEGCAGAITNWRGCTHDDPDYNAWASVADEMVTMAGNIEDREVLQLTHRLQLLSNSVISARSAAAAKPFEEKVWSAYEALDVRLSELIRTN
jgi:hypothetical protein